MSEADFAKRNGSHNSRFILAVEDDVHTAGVLRIILEEEGYSFRCEQSADAALEWAGRNGAEGAGKHTRIDLILLDLSMPGMDPVELPGEMKKAGLNVPPIVLMSARPSRAIAEAAESTKAAGVISKPFALDDLLRCIEKVLDS